MKKTPKDMVLQQGEKRNKPESMKVGHRKGSLLLPYSEHEKVFVKHVGEKDISVEEYIDPELQVADGNEKRVARSEENVGAGSSVNKEHIANE
ncbi:hypothetical protein C5167_025214 [Papaver somniferum]|uniref:Uncharacterized protein n=1 Tax=Papaver somniferum TaxID=3469 RepID=A0A4Y7JTR4_PAPSO|nr:hypothetical protein C5167_025214 [Papaver somniferum]